MIKSSFKKIQKNTTTQKIYFGHPDLDAIFWNNIPQGHLIVLEQDHPTTHYLSLLRYYISSSYNKNIPSLIVDSSPNRWKYLLSPPLKKSKKKEQQKNQIQKSQIAWRYDKMDIKLNQLVINQDIQYLDLSKQITPIKQQYLKTILYPHNSLEKLYKIIQQSFIQIQSSQKDNAPKKILLSTIPSYYYNDSQFSQFLQALRCLTRSSHVLTLITIPPIISQKIRNKLLTYTDYYLKIDQIGQSYKDFNASLKILKQVQSCQIKSNYRGQSIWGIKNKKRQLQIQALYEQAVEDDPQQIKNSSKPLCSQQKTQIDF